MSFFEEVLPDSVGYCPIILRDVRGALTDTQWFEWPSEKGKMIEYVEDHSGEDVYFSPMLYKEPRTRTDARHVTRENVTAVASVYSDADTANPADFKIVPTISVETSDGRWHLYWRLTDHGSVDPDTVEQLAHALYISHKDDGVDSGWALSKRLRVPSTTNTKDGRSWTVVAERTGEALTVAEFAAEYPPIDRGEITGIARPIPDTPEETFDVLNRIPSDARILTLVMNAPVGDRSTALFELEMRLFEAGLTPEEVFAVVRNAACNKFKQQGRSETELWKHVLRAEQHHLDNMANKDDTEPEFVSDPIEASVYEQTWDKLDMLDAEEREQLKPTFISEFADWGKRRSPKSARPYHEAAAWTILSVVFSEFGHLIPSFGRVPLNLYFLTLGRTTQSRKSTSKNFMLDIIRAISNDDYRYQLPNDVTAEALTEALAKRENRSTLVWKDEVQGMFENASSRGGYLKGLLPMLTNTYDGRVDGMLRRTGNTKSTDSVQTYLIYYGMGILDLTAKALTEDDFHSGFLPRVVISIDHGDESSREFGSHDVFQDESTGDMNRDVAFLNFVTDILEARKFWAQRRNKAGGTLPIRANDAAWKRWQDFTARIEQLAFEHPTRSMMLSPSAQRLGMTVLKCAALLAMLNKRDTIEVRDMLTAIHYGNEWAKFMEEMTRQVSATDQARDIDELEGYVSSTAGGVTYGKALAKFKGRKSVKEFNELLDYCIQTGSLSMEVEGKTKKIRSNH